MTQRHRFDRRQKCQTCGVKLLNPHGYAGTDLCGPCCTGDSSTIHDICTHCPKHCWQGLTDMGTCAACAAGAAAGIGAHLHADCESEKI